MALAADAGFCGDWGVEHAIFAEQDRGRQRRGGVSVSSRSPQARRACAATFGGTRSRRMTKTAAIENGERFTCPKCSSSRLRDMRRLPVLMGIWVGCLSAVALLLPVRRILPEAQVWLVLICCLPAAMLAGWMFCRVALRRAAQYECRDCHNRWRNAEPADSRQRRVGD